MGRIIDGTQSNIVGGKIRQLRIQQKLSQKQITEKLELLAVYVCRGSISRIEDHSRTVTDIELKAFAQIFGVTVNDLFDR